MYAHSIGRCPSSRLPEQLQRIGGSFLQEIFRMMVFQASNLGYDIGFVCACLGLYFFVLFDSKPDLTAGTRACIITDKTDIMTSSSFFGALEREQPINFFVFQRSGEQIYYHTSSYHEQQGKRRETLCRG